jgi:hypothetical protein
MWQAAIQMADRLVIGSGTEDGHVFPEGTDFGSDYQILDIEDDSQLEVLNQSGREMYVTRASPFQVVDAPNKV